MAVKGSGGGAELFQGMNKRPLETCRKMGNIAEKKKEVSKCGERKVQENTSLRTKNGGGT